MFGDCHIGLVTSIDRLRICEVFLLLHNAGPLCYEIVLLRGARSFKLFLLMLFVCFCFCFFFIYLCQFSLLFCFLFLEEGGCCLLFVFSCCFVYVYVVFCLLYFWGFWVFFGGEVNKFRILRFGPQIDDVFRQRLSRLHLLYIVLQTYLLVYIINSVITYLAINNIYTFKIYIYILQLFAASHSTNI